MAGGARGNGAQGGPQTSASLAPLHIAENAPPKNKAVTLVYGGGFNPTHEGHSTALVDSYNQLTNAGYTVDRIVVAPTSDRLLAEKVNPVDHISSELVSIRWLEIESLHPLPLSAHRTHLR